MSTPLSNGPFGENRHELEKLQHEWYWFLLLGILLIVGGTLAIGYSISPRWRLSPSSAWCWSSAADGKSFSAFWAGHWSGFLLSLLAGILYVVVGGMMVARPLVGEKR